MNHRFTVIALALASLSVPAMAQSPVSTGAKVSNLVFQTVDLRPADPYAAQFTMNNPTGVRGALGGLFYHNESLSSGMGYGGFGTPFTARLLPTENKTESLFDGQFIGSASTNGDLSAQVDMSLATANALLATRGAGVSRSRLPSETIGGWAYSMDKGSFNYSSTSNWTLSPYSSVVVSARITLSNDFDTSQLDQAALADIYAAKLNSEALARFQFRSSSGDVTVSDGNLPAVPAQGGVFQYSLQSALDVAATGTLLQQVWVDGVLLADGSTPAAYRDVQFTITNNTGGNVSGSLLYLTEGYSRMVLSVPEPATWASFALGLGFVGAAVARQRKRQA